MEDQEQQEAPENVEAICAKIREVAASNPKLLEAIETILGMDDDEEQQPPINSIADMKKAAQALDMKKIVGQ